MMGAVQQPPPSPEQMQLLQLARTLDTQMRQQVRLSALGAMGLGLLGMAAYLIWRRR